MKRTPNHTTKNRQNSNKYTPSKMVASVSRERPHPIPSSNRYGVIQDIPTELIIGIVGPLGTDSDKICNYFRELLSNYDYTTEVIRISKTIIPAIAGNRRSRSQNEYAYANTLMDLGNIIRERSGNNAILAIAATAEIRRLRDESPNIPKKAYIISSLKSPEEVSELRKIYGRGFYLFALHADTQKRIHYLTRIRNIKESNAYALIQRDEHEAKPYGQHTRDTFHLADFFLADEDNDGKLKFSIHRCLDLIYGNPFITPTFNEFAMFMAFASSLRSADLSRQVGAVIARDCEILSTGANDCPRPGGGLYWPEFVGDRVDDSPRGRDYKRGFDSNSHETQNIINDIASRFSKTFRNRALKALQQSRLRDITEYGRVVHAEMEAILACARNNISCQGGTLYCTTFPCHNCAKHIIAAGVRQVIYTEPYPKSRALDFHDDAVTTCKPDNCENLVRFKPFIGVGPRQFFDLFSMALSAGRPLARKQKNGKVTTWRPRTSLPRVPLLPLTHRDFEADAYSKIQKLINDWGRR